MSGIQIVLVTGIILILFNYIQSKHRPAIGTFIVLVTALLAFVFVLFPETTNQIAHWLGVGRGADFIFYICILLFWFIINKLVTRIKVLEDQLTELIRKDALRDVKKVPE